MARLTNPPNKGSIVELSSPPTSDADAATQQLLSEAHGPISHAPPSSAVLGANLLNAARVDHPHGNPAGATRQNGTGKLKRVNPAVRGARQKLATRGDMYDIELSPEKGRYMLPEKVNHKPLRIVKKNKGKGAEQVSDLVALSSELPRPSDDEPGESGHVLPSSPPRLFPDESATIVAENTGKRSFSHIEGPQQSSPPVELRDPDTHVEESAQVQVETTLSNGKSRCTVVFYRYDKQGSRHQQCLRPGANSTDAGPRCSTHIRMPAAVQCSSVGISDGTTTRCPKVATTETTHGAKCPTHADDPTPEAKSKRKSSSGQGDEQALRPRKSSRQHIDGPSSLRKSQPQSQISVRKSTELQTAQEDSYVDDARASQQDGELDPKEAGPVTAPTEKRPRSRRQTNDGSQSIRQQQQATNDVVADPNYVPEEGGSENKEPEAEGSQPAANKDEDPEDATEIPGPLDAVFKFLDHGERSDKCSTKLGISIRRICRKSCSQLQDADISLDEIVKNTEDVRESLKRITTELEKTKRRPFKGEAYAHIFRALTLYLEALYDWLVERFDVVTESLEAMRILSPLVHDILLFKDTMSTWKVSISCRYDGDRVIRNVESGLIAPLRQVHKTFRVRMRQLEVEEQQRKQRAALERRLKREEEKKQRDLEAEELKKERWKRWQDLHIMRMWHEPNPVKRRKLFIPKLEDMEETDANGFKFERVPVFKTRSTPHMHLVSSREWTEEQEEALLEGLQAFAGPDVFEKIFENYCKPAYNGRPDGELRNFTVVDILAKTAWVRDAMVKLHQEQGDEMPEWVSKIPTLP